MVVLDKNYGSNSDNNNIINTVKILTDNKQDSHPSKISKNYGSNALGQQQLPMECTETILSIK